MWGLGQATCLPGTNFVAEPGLVCNHIAPCSSSENVFEHGVEPRALSQRGLSCLLGAYAEAILTAQLWHRGMFPLTRLQLLGLTPRLSGDLLRSFGASSKPQPPPPELQLPHHFSVDPQPAWNQHRVLRALRDLNSATCLIRRPFSACEGALRLAKVRSMHQHTAVDIAV